MPTDDVSGTPPPPPGSGSGGDRAPSGTWRAADRALGAVLLLGICLWMVRAHWETIDLPKREQKLRLHERVLANEAADPYQYKLWLISHALEAAHAWTGQDLEAVFFANTLLSLLFLVGLHHLWLRGLAGPRGALAGGVLLGALANILFLTYYHHPYEFWGIGLFCLLLHGISRGWDWRALAALFLLTGTVWEKHAPLAFLWGLLALHRGERFLPSLARGLVLLAAGLVAPLLVRAHLGTDRAHVDGDTFLAVQEWGKVLWFQLPFLMPFVLLFLLRNRALSTWVRLLWLYLPLLVLAYTIKHYILHEVRSFWPLVPVFTATACLAWARDYRPGPQSCQAAQ